MASMWAFGGLSWRELGSRLWRQVSSDDAIGRAAQLSFFFLFSLFPLLFFLTALLGFVSESEAELRTNLLRYLRAVVPTQAHLLIRDTLEEVIEASSGGKVWFGLLLALWTASFGVDSVRSTLNAAYGVTETRPWWKARLMTIILTIALAALIVSALVILISGEGIGLFIAQRLGLGDTFTLVWNVAQWPAVLAFVLLALALVYYFAPNVDTIRWQWITPGSLLGLSLWLAVSFGFRTYLSYFNTYSMAYGSLGAVMILLLWLYLTGAAILVGGELNAVIEDAAAKAGEPDAKERGEKHPGEKQIDPEKVEARLERSEKRMPDDET